MKKIIVVFSFLVLCACENQVELIKKRPTDFLSCVEIGGTISEGDPMECKLGEFSFVEKVGKKEIPAQDKEVSIQTEKDILGLLQKDLLENNPSEIESFGISWLNENSQVDQFSGLGFIMANPIINNNEISDLFTKYEFVKQISQSEENNLKIKTGYQKDALICIVEKSLAEDYKITKIEIKCAEFVPRVNPEIDLSEVELVTALDEIFATYQALSLIQFSEKTDSIFTWQKDDQSVEISGQKILATISEDMIDSVYDVIEDFSYQKDDQNSTDGVLLKVNGYQKEDIVCLISSEKDDVDENVKVLLEISCGNLSK